MNQAILGIVPDERRVVQAFLRCWLQHIEAHLEQFSSSNTQDNLNAGKVRAMPLFLPDVPEQRLIADFLDRETARLDRLVAKKREVIERLKEKRTALISRTVTRGLPPSAARAAGLPENPPLKPSGIEWLGDIPAHWGVSRLKYCVANIFSGGTPESGNDEYWAWDDDEGIPWVAIADMTRSPVVTNTDRRITRAGLASKRLQILPAGTLLYSMYASLGKVATLRVAATMNQAILGIVPDERRVVQAFLRCWLQHIEAHLEQFSSSNTQDNLNAGKVRAMPLFLPDVPEQRLIADFLDRETVKLDALVAKVKAAIERLQEYRAALITAAVTGKIDVRGEVDP
jgi:type I restriction enzyme S subunit